MSEKNATPRTIYMPVEFVSLEDCDGAGTFTMRDGTTDIMGADLLAECHPALPGVDLPALLVAIAKAKVDVLKSDLEGAAAMCDSKAMDCSHQSRMAARGSQGCIRYGAERDIWERRAATFRRMAAALAKP